MSYAPRQIFLGWDASQMRAWSVAAYSFRQHATEALQINRIAMGELSIKGLYTRPTRFTQKGYWDVLSGAPMSTGHAIARFLVPSLCDYRGWALFTDGDVLAMDDLARLFALADPSKAVQVVQHAHNPLETVKMTGAAQTTYARKNWSSVILWNAGHEANRALTVQMVNELPGRDLHRFCWLDDALVGALPARWNVLVGAEQCDDPGIVHFTEGVPDMPGYERVPYAEDWYRTARAAGHKIYPPEERTA